MVGISDPKMLQAIGRVAVQAAIVEAQIHCIHWNYAGLTTELGQVFTEKMRPKFILQDAIKIARINGIPEGRLQDLEDISIAYGNAAQQRNEIVHWIWNGECDRTHAVGAPGYMANKFGVLKPYTTKKVEQVADALKAISERLTGHLISDDDLRTFGVILANYDGSPVPAPWLDTPSQPKPKPQKTPRTRK